ncbi:hypothetical protein Bbelb_204370 [Branchiostoma belcheri]|nr:hypothetical protein Bbelb_204370 [Branchiostoma belcheri]
MGAERQFPWRLERCGSGMRGHRVAPPVPRLNGRAVSLTGVLITGVTPDRTARPLDSPAPYGAHLTPVTSRHAAQSKRRCQSPAHGPRKTQNGDGTRRKNCLEEFPVT